MFTLSIISTFVYLLSGAIYYISAKRQFKGVPVFKLYKNMWLYTAISLLIYYGAIFYFECHIFNTVCNVLGTGLMIFSHYFTKKLLSDLQ